MAKRTRQLHSVCLIALIALLSVSLANAAQPTLLSTSFSGGPGDQTGTSIVIQNGAIYVTGIGSPENAQLRRYSIPPGTPTWSDTLNGGGFLGGTATNGVVYSVGNAIPPNCGALDQVGDTEAKSLRARYDAVTGSFLGCASTNYFPYQGSEFYSSAVVNAGLIYVAGAAETCGFGNISFVLSSMDLSGNLLNTTNESGGACIGGSDAEGLAALNGNIYVAGSSNFEDHVNRPVLLKYGTDFVRQWKVRPTDSAPGGRFQGIVAFGGAIYVVGYVGPFGTRDYLIEKYDETGARIWSKVSGGSGDDLLNGIVGIGNRLYAVGSTNSQGAGGLDGVVLEIDPATGNTLSTTLYGGAQDDSFAGAATDGTDLYVIGTSQSFASAAGNQIGQNDIVLARYSVNSVVCPTMNSFAITNYQLVSQQPASGSQAYLTYRADIVNTGTPVATVTATLTSLDPFSIRVAPGQGVLNFAPIPANSQVTSSNTFTIIADPSVPLNPAKLQWAFASTPPTPVANGGPNQTVAAGSTVILDGSESINPSCTGTLSYSWMFESRPAGSTTHQLFSTGTQSSFIADVAGTYVVQLTVSNGSASNSTTITVTAH